MFTNSVTLKMAGPLGKYSGRVNSGRPRCECNRGVQVSRLKAGPDVRLGTTFTSGAGGWTLFAPPCLGNGRKVDALIETKVLTSNPQHDHICPVDLGGEDHPYP